MTAPAWARVMLARICRDEEISVPVLRWTASAERFSSGQASFLADLRNRACIRVVAGTALADVRHVLIHEIAHHVAGLPYGHSAPFYWVNFALQERWGNLRYSVQRESHYIPSSVHVARAFGCRVPPRDAPVVPPALTTWHIWRSLGVRWEDRRDDPDAAVEQTTVVAEQRRTLVS